MEPAHASPLDGAVTRDLVNRRHGHARIVCTLVVLVAVVGYRGDVHAPSGRPVVYAHRGATAGPDSAPENSGAAIGLAVAGGVEGVEVDVQLSADLTFWLLHDDMLDRTTTGTGRLRELTAGRLRVLRLDGGLGWRPIHATLGLTTLSEALDVIGPTTLLNVDLKDDREIAGRVLGRILAAGHLGWRTIVNVKSHAQAMLIREAVPGVTIMAQPDWVPDANTAADVDLVLVWGSQLAPALRVRPASQVGLFRNTIAEADIRDEVTWAIARRNGLAVYLTDDLRITSP